AQRGRIQSTSLGKRTPAARACDYGSFYARAALALALLPRQDALIAMTTPPLIALVGLGPQKLRRTRLIYWCQDLYPDVAVAFGVLGKRSPAAVSLGLASRTVLSQSDRIVVLGEAMRQRVLEAGARDSAIDIIPNWSDDAAVTPLQHSENPLRAEIARNGQFVVMYSGNMGPGHDMETLIGAARRLRP